MLVKLLIAWALPPKPCSTNSSGAGSPLDKSETKYERTRPSAVVIELNPGGTTPAEVGCVAGVPSATVVVTASPVVAPPGSVLVSVLAAAQPLRAIRAAVITSGVVRRIGAFIVAA
jgi:hypothetical protein